MPYFQTKTENGINYYRRCYDDNKKSYSDICSKWQINNNGVSAKGQPLPTYSTITQEIKTTNLLPFIVVGVVVYFLLTK